MRNLEEKAKLHFERIEEMMKMEFSSQARMMLLARKFDYNITRRAPVELIGELREVMHYYKAHSKSLDKMRNEI